MKIIFIGNSGQKYDAARYYLSERRIYNGFVRNGHDVWFFADREEIRAASPFGIRMIGKKRVNNKLLRVIANFQPDAIFMLNANVITPETLGVIKEIYPQIKLAQIIYDPIFDVGNRISWNERLPYVDCHFFTTAGRSLADFSVQGRPCYFIPNMTDSAIDVGRVFEVDSPLYDVSCVMNQSSDRKIQEGMLIDIKNELPHITFAYHGFGGYPGVRGAEYVRLITQSAMSISFSRSTSHGEISSESNRYLYSSDRIAQLMGNGCLTFVEDIFSLDKLYSHDEVVFFSGKDDLKEKIVKFSRDPVERQRIAKNGWKKAHTQFSTDLVTRYMLERLFDQPLGHDYQWPLDAQIKSF